MDRPSILVVEDNAVLQKVIELFCKRMDVCFRIAGTASDALTVYENGCEPYSLIFMDWKLPDLDGLECTKRIREIEHRCGKNYTPVVAMTANVFSDAKTRCLEAGMDDYMSKPFSYSQFKDMVLRWVSGRQVAQKAM